MGFSWSVAFIRYGAEWRRNRAVIHKKFHPAAAAKYHPIQAKHIRSDIHLLPNTRLNDVQALASTVV
jgi:cytochrome P450